jgi:DNA-binding transcriptional MerR regulator
MARARKKKAANPTEVTYPLRAVSRLTGLSEHVLRAWERRYGAVKPNRTPGGTRRYSEEDIERLRLLAEVVNAGYPIGEIANLPNDELLDRVAGSRAPSAAPEIPTLVESLAVLDVAEVERRIAFQLSTLGPARLARDFALPLLEAIGEGWASERLSVASEHLATATLRSLLGATLRPAAGAARGPRIVFGTPAGERHELGILIAALTAQGAGGDPVYLGPDLPAEELLNAVSVSGASALALGIVGLGKREATQAIRTIRAGLPDSVELWIGGGRTAEIELPEGVQFIGNMDALDAKVQLLALRGSPRH